MFEMPFTQAGKRQGGVEEQCKRRTVLTGTHWTEISFKRKPFFYICIKYTYMCIYVCIYIQTYICIYIQTYIHTHIYILIS